MGGCGGWVARLAGDWWVAAGQLMDGCTNGKCVSYMTRGCVNIWCVRLGGWAGVQALGLLMDGCANGKCVSYIGRGCVDIWRVRVGRWVGVQTRG